MGENNEKKFSETEELKIFFYSFDTKVLDAIEKSFASFLAITNFGTRQSKGFGSFYLKDQAFEPTLVSTDTFTKVYSFESSLQHYQKDINTLYKFLRTGINDFNFRTKTSTFYTKPAIFHYAKKMGWIWDKRAIKEELLHVAQKTDPHRYRLLRDLFGLSTEQLWLSYDKTKILKSHPTIDRYKSPIIFKPIKMEKNRIKIFFFADKTDSMILNQSFKIKATKQHTNMRISTPERFDWQSFFDFAFDLRLQNIVDSKYHNTPTFATLDKILKQIRSGR